MYQLAPVSSSAAITQLLRRALYHGGAYPKRSVFDNGRDYASERVALLAGRSLSASSIAALSIPRRSRSSKEPSVR